MEFGDFCRVEREAYDVVFIGSGMGALVCAHILADSGLSVCVLEKNQQLGGSLQVFSRNKTLFDTGVHYIGGLDEGLPLHRVFTYLGLIDGVKWLRMDDHHDRITFSGDQREYYHAQGWDNFAHALTDQFPAERSAVAKYMATIRQMLDNFPIDGLHFSDKDHLNDDLLGINARDFIASITQNEKLRAVLGGTNLLHAGTANMPLHAHALVTGGYMQSAHKCVDGGSQMAKVLAQRIRQKGGVVLRRKEVVKLEMKGDQVVAAHCADGDRVAGKRFISNLHPLLTYQLAGPEHVKLSTLNRLQRMPLTLASFNVHVVCKPGSFPYLNHNHYHHTSTNVWANPELNTEPWPQTYMLSTPASSRGGEGAEGISIMTYMRSDEVARWQSSFNTVTKPGVRGHGYEQFKQQKAEAVLQLANERFQGIANAAQAIYTTTPLTFRDYLGHADGALYGYAKDFRFPFRGFISPQTRIQNLLLTGQHIHLHGIQGVTISALVTCSHILGRHEVLRRVKGE